MRIFSSCLSYSNRPVSPSVADGEHPIPEKPKGMHYMTYWRLLLRLRETEEAFFTAVSKLIRPDRPDWSSLSPSVEKAFAESEISSTEQRADFIS